MWIKTARQNFIGGALSPANFRALGWQARAPQRLLIGPLLTGLSRPVHVLQRGSEVNDIVHVAAVAVVDSQEVGKPYRTLSPRR